jgi:hypothetical protein
VIRGGPRLALWVGCLALLVFGLVAFLAPSWAAERFPWRVGPFLAQTIGGWAMGTAAYAALAALDGRVAVTYPLLVHLGVFGVGELGVAVAFLDKLATGSVLTWPYLAGLVAVAAGALWAGVDALLHRGQGSVVVGGSEAPPWMRVGALLFAVFVGLLALGTLLAGPDGSVAQGRFFPEAMTPFSIRAFSAFFLAIAASALSVVPERRLRPPLELSLAGLVLLVPITVAALWNLALFDFAGRPGGALYLVAYVASIALFGSVVWRYRRELR